VTHSLSTRVLLAKKEADLQDLATELKALELQLRAKESALRAQQAAHYLRTIHRIRLTLRVHFPTDFVQLSRRRQSCDELDMIVWAASGKPRSIGQRGWPCLSFSIPFRVTSFRPFHCACSCSPLPFCYTSIPLSLSCCSPFSAKEHRLLAVVTIIEQKRKRTRRGQRSSLFTAASRGGSNTRETADKHKAKAHRGHSPRPKEEM
jgi:hypothetical protein